MPAATPLSSSGSSSSSHHNCMLFPPWLDHLVESVCNDSCDPQQYGAALVSSSSAAIGISHRLPPIDGQQYFSQQHDLFLDSLLHEQINAGSSSGDANCSTTSSSTQSNNSSSWTTVLSQSSFSGATPSTCSEDTTGSHHSTSTTNTSSRSHNNNNNNSSKPNTSRKRRRPGVRLRRKAHSPLRLYQKSANHNATSGHLETIHLETLAAGASNSNNNSTADQPPPQQAHGSTTTTSTTTATTTTIPSPHYFLHPHCRIQKDKGKGDAIGTKLCGKSAEVTLQKLRAKMQLLTEHCVVGGAAAAATTAPSSSSSSATMKRRTAKVTKWTDTYCETRSLLTIKMGFLSMTYGILLRWDVVRTQKVTLVVLRKNCHESFYKQIMMMPPPSSFPSSSTTSSWFPNPTVPRKKLSETRVTVLAASGFAAQSRWTVKMTLGEETEHVVLSQSSDQRYDNYNTNGVGNTATTTTTLVPKLNATISGMGDDDLVLSLFEHLRHSKVLRCTLRVPMTSLQQQQSSAFQTQQPTQLRVPCPNGGFLQLESIVREWETTTTGGGPTMSPLQYDSTTTMHNNETDDERQLAEEESMTCGGWEWMLCMVC